MNTCNKGVRDVLKEPDSAIFGRIIAGALDDSHTSLMVCGWVNANSFGGHTGHTPFVGTVEGVFIETAFTLSAIGDTDTRTLAVDWQEIGRRPVWQTSISVSRT